MLSRYWRAVSNRLRTIRAGRALLRDLSGAASTADGLLFFSISSLRIVPLPKQETYSASPRVSAMHGPTQWVAYHIGGRAGQELGQPPPFCWGGAWVEWCFP